MNYENGSYVLYYPTLITYEKDGNEKIKILSEKKRLFSKSEFSHIYFPHVTLPQLRKSAENDEEKDKNELKSFYDENNNDLLENIELNENIEWDQFVENEKKFNIKSEFDEEKYTTKLNLDNLTEQQKIKAEKISCEIENLQSKNRHLREDRGQLIKKSENIIKSTEEDDEDEEKFYSAVIGTGKYSMPEEKDKKRVPFHGNINAKIKQPHRNSLDCIGIDSCCIIDPDSHREMLRFKQQKNLEMTVAHIKSLSPHKKLASHPNKSVIIGKSEEKLSENSSFISLNSNLDEKSPKNDSKIIQMNIKPVNGKYKETRELYKNTYKKQARIKIPMNEWEITYEISIYSEELLYMFEQQRIFMENYYLNPYYSQMGVDMRYYPQTVPMASEYQNYYPNMYFPQ